MALKLLTNCALAQEVRNIQIFCDSALTIDWMNNRDLKNVLLRPLGDQLKLLSSSFEFISFRHVFTELNRIADSLSKAGQELQEGRIELEDSREGSSVS